MRWLLPLLFPNACAACQEPAYEGEAFCGPCETTLEPLGADEACGGCGAPAPCSRCPVDGSPFESAFSPFLHGGALATALWRLKYRDTPALAGRLAERIARASERWLSEAPSDVLAVPLHPARLRRRRYDQAQLLGATLARSTGRRYLGGALRRVKATRPQVGLSPPDRRANVADAFVALRREVEGRSLLLVDDVATTGATSRAAASALRAAGAREIHLLTFSRAPSTEPSFREASMEPVSPARSTAPFSRATSRKPTLARREPGKGTPSSTVPPSRQFLSAAFSRPSGSR